ncbi:MAG: plasmid partition protein ParG [Nitrosomonas sp.]|nr:plasmid partition protein ParG [Moraxellaceae bacterium]MDP1952029.1 plasmid partition protein ParG [Nitrosomonas sp.]
MSKKVTIGLKPTGQPKPAADNWVENRADVEPMKRLTIDITESLHRKIKSDCAKRGTKIADEVRELLLQKYGNV